VGGGKRANSRFFLLRSALSLFSRSFFFALFFGFAREKSAGAHL
jgi:hypothetical protein